MEIELAVSGTTQALVAAQLKIAEVEQTVSALKEARRADAVRMRELENQLRLIAHKHAAYLRHFGSCEKHPDT